MKLEEIEKLCSEATPGPWDLNHQAWFDEAPSIDHKFVEMARTELPKLLAIAKAAKQVCEGMKDENYFILGSELLEKALEELEKA